MITDSGKGNHLKAMPCIVSNNYFEYFFTSKVKMITNTKLQMEFSLGFRVCGFGFCGFSIWILRISSLILIFISIYKFPMKWSDLIHMRFAEIEKKFPVKYSLPLGSTLAHALSNCQPPLRLRLVCLFLLYICLSNIGNTLFQKQKQL